MAKFAEYVCPLCDGALEDEDETCVCGYDPWDYEDDDEDEDEECGDE